MDKKKILTLLISVAIAAVFFIIPPFPGLETVGMRYIGIFLAFFILLLTNTLPESVTILITLTAFVLAGVAKQSDLWSSYGGTVVWLMIPAFAIGVAVSKTGVLQRLALHILALAPSNYSGQLLAQLLSGVVISPMIPSQNAKATIISPYTVSMGKELGYQKSSKQAIGIYLAIYIPAIAMGSAFLSGSINNYVLPGYLDEQYTARFDWITWFLACLPFIVILMVAMFFVLRAMYAPSKGEAQAFGDSKAFAKKRLQEIGPMSLKEKQAAIILGLTLAGWITTRMHGIDSSLIAIMGMLLMMLLGLFEVSELRTKIPWEAVIFVGGINAIGSVTSATGVNTWLGGILAPIVAPLAGNVFLFILAICAVTFLLRLGIISFVVTWTIIFAIFVPTAIAMGINPWIVLMAHLFISNNWSFNFSNAQTLTAIVACGGELVEYRDIQKMSYIFSALSAIAMLASVPVWRMMGLM